MNNVVQLPTIVSFEEARLILSGLHKFANEDWAFGDAECFWQDDDGNEVAGGYAPRYMIDASIWFSDARCQLAYCTPMQMRELFKCYKTITRGRNDSTPSKESYF